MLFQKGQSGNPGGKPKELKDIQLEARKLSSDALKTLAEISKSGKSEAARVTASALLLDRAWGKPPQHISADIGPKRVLRELTYEELAAIAAGGAPPSDFDPRGALVADQEAEERREE